VLEVGVGQGIEPQRVTGLVRFAQGQFGMGAWGVFNVSHAQPQSAFPGGFGLSAYRLGIARIF
jgi:hypothetical protein